MPGKRKTEAGRWLLQARYDLKAAEWNLEGGFHNTVCFLAQQSAEKALKSMLYYLGARKKALMTHSLAEMVSEASKKVEGLSDLMDEARALDMHYIPSRYPNGLPGGFPHEFYSPKMAREALACARKLLDVTTAYYEAQGEADLLLGT
jgi:HEPN domain-containing protein